MTTAHTGVQAHPLQWPAGKPRTVTRERSRFGDDTFARLLKLLLNEVRLLAGSAVVVSSNLRLRQDGFPMSGQAQPADVGVAVYFLDRRGKQKCFACDRWNKVEHNLKAIVFTIEALRGIDRWGGGDMVEAAFAGFTALPPARPVAKWAAVFGMPDHSPTIEVHERYRVLALRHHPDRGGSQEEMAAINAAYDEFKRERGLT
jgi:hypothetical protein